MQVLKRRPGILFLGIMLLTAYPAAAADGAPAPHTCARMVLTGEVSAGHEWHEAIGEGWVLRMLPIPKDKTAAGEAGWDLVVDRADPAGFPDALLVANPPYNLINSREIGTTFGLRAQDAIGWNPRSFHFLANRSAFRQAQRLYLLLDRYGQLGGKPKVAASGRKAKALNRAMQRFEKLARESSPGEFRILDAQLTPGVAQVKPYAANWALKSSATPHTDTAPQGATPTPLGKLEWIRFSVTLWLPEPWKTRKDVELSHVPCPEPVQENGPQ